MGFPGGSDGKEYACKAGDLGLEYSPGERNGTPLQYSCLDNSMDRGTWKTTVHGISDLDMTGQLVHSTQQTSTVHYSHIPNKSYNNRQLEFSSVQSLSCVQLFVTPWTAARQASLSITNSLSLLKLTSIVLVMPSNHLILCHPLLLLPSIFPSIRIFSNKSVFHIKWPKYWNIRFSISHSNEYYRINEAKIPRT